MTRRRTIIISGILLPLTIVALTLLGTSRARSTSQAPDLKLLDRTLAAVSRNYLDPDRIDPRKMLQGAVDEIQLKIPEILVKDDGRRSMTVTVGLAAKRFNVKAMRTLVDLQRATHGILTFIAAHYQGETKFEEIEYAAIDGMLDTLDPHSSFLPPKIFTEFKVGTRGKFGGLGIVISIKDGMLTVIAPLEGTPASRAGIRAGDRIVQIDDQSTINMSLTDAVNKLRGDVGTKVTVVIERKGQPSRKVTITRASINIESVKSLVLTEGDRRIGYLKVKSFQSNTDDDVRKALKAFHKDGAKIDGLILDMRNNPGGLLNVAVDLSNHFLREGIIVSTVGAHNRLLDRDVATNSGTEPDYPIIALINEGSASASEIVAGALQANDRAVVMGRRSFGKGSVQTIFELGSDTALKLTIAQYKPAGTESIQLVGLTPDIEMVPITVERDAMNLIADELPSEKDLEEHLDNQKAKKTEIGAEPVDRVRFLKPKEDEDEMEKRSVREYAKVPQIEGDFTVTLARTLIAQAGAGTRKAMLAAAAELLKQANEDQQKQIDEALKKLGIDWTIGKANGKPQLKVAYNLRVGKGRVARAKAGQKVFLDLTATNVGNGPYYRLLAVGESDLSFLDNREFPFGRLAPGATRTWSIPVELPESLPRENMLMELSFKEAHGRTPEPMDVVVPVSGRSAPLFGFSYRLPATSRGKSLATGSPISFPVDVINAGSGSTSDETTVALSNECGEKLFIEKGRSKLGVMAPGAKRRASFRFHLARDFGEATCQVELTVADLKHRVFLVKKIDLLVPKGATEPPGGREYRPPSIKLKTFPASTNAAQASIAGTITDTDAVRDYYIFVGEKKVAYVPNPLKSSELSFEISVPLEPGNNRILIAARDEYDLTSRKLIVIERTEGSAKPKSGK